MRLKLALRGELRKFVCSPQICPAAELFASLHARKQVETVASIIMSVGGGAGGDITSALRVLLPDTERRQLLASSGPSGCRFNNAEAAAAAVSAPPINESLIFAMRR